MVGAGDCHFAGAVRSEIAVGQCFPVASAQLLVKRLAAGNKRRTRRLFDVSMDLVSKVVERVMENQILLGQPPGCGFIPRPIKLCKEQFFRFMLMTLPVE